MLILEQPAASIQRQVRTTFNFENKKTQHMLPLASLVLNSLKKGLLSELKIAHIMKSKLQI